MCPIRSNPLDFAHAGSRATALTRCATRLPTALQRVCQALACWWREGSNCAPADQLWAARLHVLRRRPGDTLVRVDQHPRRRLPGPRSGPVGHHSWSLTNKHHSRISTRTQSGRLWLCVAQYCRPTAPCRAAQWARGSSQKASDQQTSQLLSTSHQSGFAFVVLNAGTAGLKRLPDFSIGTADLV